MANGTTAPAQQNVWAGLIDRGLEGWLSYLNRPRDVVLQNVSPFGPSQPNPDTTALAAQVAQQQAMFKTLLLVAGAGLVLYLVVSGR